MGKAKVIVSGVAWTAINNVVSIIYGIISVPFLINYFGKEEYGLIGLALSVNVYIQLLDMGMTNSNVRFFSEYISKGEKDNVQKLFGLTNFFYLLVGILNSVLLFGVSFFVSDLFKVTAEQAIILRNLLWILALNATFSWISVCFDQFLRANELIDWIKKRTTFLKVMQFVILALTVWLHLSIELYFFGYIFIGTVIFPLTIVKTRKIKKGLKTRPKFDMGMLRIVYPYAISIFSFSIFQFLAFNFRPLFLGNMSGPGSVAEFNIMNAIATVVTILSGTFIQVLLPIVTKMRVNSDTEGINSLIFRGTKFANILLSTIIVILIISSKEVLTLYVGEEYTSLSLWLTLWLLTLCLSHRNVMTSLVFTEKKLKSVAIMGAVAMLLAIAAYVIFIPRYGVGGVVIGFLIHELVHTLFYYFYFFPVRLHVHSGQIFLKSVLPCWIACLIVGVAVYKLGSLLSLPSLWSLLLKTLISCCSLLPLIWFFIFSDSDKNLILSSSLKKIKKTD